MRPRRFIKSLKDLAPEDLGQGIFSDSFIRVLLESDISKPRAIKLTNSLYKKLTNFLELDSKLRDVPLKLEVITEILYDYIKLLIPFSEYETELRRKDRLQLGTACSEDKGDSSHIDGKTHFIQELYMYLVFGSIRKDDIQLAVPEMSPKEAREFIAEWVLPFEPTTDGDELGSAIRKKAQAIQKASKRWNVYQAPNRKRGVYKGFKVVRGKKLRDVSYDLEVIKCYTPSYPRVNKPSRRPD